jgi:ATP-dependent helicase/DNAse subunit B
VRLLAPTATMAAHVRNQLAREGLLLRRNTVQTLAHFLEELRLGGRALAALELDQVMRKVLGENCPAAYEELAGRVGFRQQLLRACEELALGRVRPEEVEGALGQVYRRLVRELEARGTGLRGRRLEMAAAGLTAEVLAGVEEVLLDGFYQFSRAEEYLVERLAEFVQVRVAAPERGGVGECYRKPVVQGVAAQNREQEALWIGHQILELDRRGVGLNRIGVLMRNPEVYEPLLEATLERLKIPSRTYRGRPLALAPVTEFFRQFVAAAAAGWENGALLKAMRWRFTGWGGTERGDAVDFEVRRGLPSQSLEAFPELAVYAHWDRARWLPGEAAEELKRLGQLVRGEDLRALEEVIEATAALLPEEALGMAEFWAEVEVNLGGAAVYGLDRRREVVHLLDVYEARQWELDYVFAPGLTAEEFPQRPSPDPFLPEALRRQLGLRTMEDRHAEELFLAEVLLTRAREGVYLLYPATNEKGAPQQPSPLLPYEFVAAVKVEVEGPECAVVRGTETLGLNYRPAGAWSASEFEQYLGCPWRHFAARGLRLEGLPETPAERLNALLLGNVAHEAIRVYTEDPRVDIEAVGERLLEQACRRERAPMGFEYERARIHLLRNLRLYVKNAPEAPAGWVSKLEEPFEIEHASGVRIRGRIDRYDQSPVTGEIHVYDYKYSRADGLEEKYPIQGALYAQALGPEVSQFAYVALREQAKAKVIAGEALTDLITMAAGQIEQVLANVNSGNIAVRPVDEALCRYCDYRDACRIRARAEEEEEMAAGAGN